MKQTIESNKYDKFLERLSVGVLRELGTGYEARAITNLRNNGVACRGILIRRQEESVSPAIYLEDYYKDYCHGTSLSDIVRQVIYVYREAADEHVDPELKQLPLTAEYIRENLVFRIVNYDRNEKLLSQIPHLRFLDLAVIFQIMVYRKDEGIGTIRFTEDHYALWKGEDLQTGIEVRPIGEEKASARNGKKTADETSEQSGEKAHEDASSQSGNSTENMADAPEPCEGKTPNEAELAEIFALAMENTQRLFPERFNPLEKLFTGWQDRSFFSENILSGKKGPAPGFGMYVLTNDAGVNGASCLLYPGLLQKIREYFRTDYYILPSSIHETILLPVYQGINPDGLSEMVKEINLTQVPEEEVLSDCAYHSDDFERAVWQLAARGKIQK